MIESLAKFLFSEKIDKLKENENQKSLFFDFSEADQVLTALEKDDIQFKFCRICEQVVQADTDHHFALKSHVRRRDELQLKETEDLQFSTIAFSSTPGDISDVVHKEREKALKRKVKRIRQQLNQMAVSHENASTYPGKEIVSSNKKLLQVRALDLEKTVQPSIQNYEVLRKILDDIVKVFDPSRMTTEQKRPQTTQADL